MEDLHDSPVTAAQIESWTRRDPSMAPVMQALLQGWPEEKEPELEPFYSKRSELSLYCGCVVWGSRMVVPQRGREVVLQELHVGHPGMSKMKSLA